MSVTTVQSVPRASSASAQGPRSHQEDRDLIYESKGRNNYILLCIADGHAGGPQVAEYAVEQLPKLIQQHRDLPAQDQIAQALYELGRLTKEMHAGSTVSAVHIEDNVAHVAFMGDSPIIILDEKDNMVISDVHNVYSNRRERDEACERGGKYQGYYVYGPSGSGLQLTRSLGDSSMGSVIKREPEFYSVKLGPQSIVIICSDGILDLAHSEDEGHVDHVVRMVQAGAEAEQVLKWAASRALNDNATVIVYRHQ